MGIIKRYHCPKCHSEFDAYCPICANCAEVAWEMHESEWLKDDEILSIDEILGEIERKEENNNNEWEV